MLGATLFYLLRLSYSLHKSKAYLSVSQRKAPIIYRNSLNPAKTERLFIKCGLKTTKSYDVSPHPLTVQNWSWNILGTIRCHLQQGAVAQFPPNHQQSSAVGHDVRDVFTLNWSEKLTIEPTEIPKLRETIFGAKLFEVRVCSLLNS